MTGISVRETLVMQNTATDGSGGGMVVRNGDSTFGADTLFEANAATNVGGNHPQP